MDKRQKALDALKEQIRRQRAEIDPAVLQKAQKAAESKNSDPILKPETVTYDKKSAQKAIEIFLSDHADQEKFVKQLSLFLEKNKN